MTARPGLTTEIAAADLHHIWVRGHDLTADLMGKLTFAEMVFLMISGRIADPQERRLLDAILVALVEHGLTPSALVARVTFSVAPESFQGAVAAGLLGVGSQILGSMEECGQLLTRIQTQIDVGKPQSQVVQDIMAEYRRENRRLPGLGHAIHTEGDPRAIRLYSLAEECGRRGPHLDALQELANATESTNRAHLPINVTGAVAAILLELGVPWELHRGFALISRTAGLMAHIGEELTDPITPAFRLLLRSGGASPAGGASE